MDAGLMLLLLVVGALIGFCLGLYVKTAPEICYRCLEREDYERTEDQLFDDLPQILDGMERSALLKKQAD